MPATEETYRRQSTLHLIFAVSSIAMLLTSVWMIMADHLRPWKQVQRQFQDVETAKLEASRRQKLQEQQAKHQAEIQAIDREIAEAEKAAETNAGPIRQKEREIERTKGEFQRLDTAKRFQKAELDSLRSFYDGMIDRDERAEAARYVQSKIVPAEKELQRLTVAFEDVEDRLHKQEQALADLRGRIDEKKKRKEDLERDVARIQRQLDQKEAQYGKGGLYSRTLAFLRGLPVIDLAAPPTKIQQISLPELTINYNFKDVPRYDRCTTCHLGIDRPAFATDVDGKTPMKDAHAAFAAHPRLTDGAMAIDPKGRLVQVGLYLDANGPHPINSFGCTICHGGQGSGTSFTYASHEPNDPKQKQAWEEEHGWQEIHFWDEPMLPKRFMESSCLKCHHLVTDIPEQNAPKLRAGYERITKYGCTGCHTIGGEGAFGPDLTDNRQVGPNLKHLGSKVSREWALKWVKNPHAFRPDTRMPRFYEVSNNLAPEDQDKVNAEVHAITHYLFAVSEPPKGFVDPPVKGDAARGKTLFFEKGCLACHAHKEYDPKTFPKPVQQYARADFGPNLSNVAAKFPSGKQGYRWLANWIHDPGSYHPKSLMPNLQLSLEDAADIASWLLSVPAEWPRPVDVPKVDDKGVERGLDELVKLYLSKAKVYKKQTILLSQIDSTVAAMSQDEKLMYLGEKTISRLGCFGCHNIKGFETAKPIGTPLNGWGIKAPSKLDFGHIVEYVTDPSARDENMGALDPEKYEYFREKVVEHKRSGFLFQKLHRPRSYDYRKTKEDLKSWDDRLRMPQFAWADDAEAVEEVMTFVLGLTGEKIAARYLPQPRYQPVQIAKAKGERLLTRYHCKGCHVLEMPRFTIPAGIKVADALPDLQTNIDVSYGDRAKDYLSFYSHLGITYDPKAEAPKPAPDVGRGDVTFEGMPVASTEEEGDPGKPPTRRVSVQLWKPATILGYTFNVGDKVVIDPDKFDPKKDLMKEADGGNFAWLYSTTQAEKTGSYFGDFWNRLPPPLIREGNKVQTPWLTSFLKDPYPIRPAVQLRMPRFHYGSTLEEQGGSAASETAGAASKAQAEAQGEVRDLANFFAARDGAEFPYQDIPERERAYLSEREAKHADYLDGGWTIITKGLCVQCHAIGQYKPTGGAAVVNGPDLRQVAPRFRPEYLKEWLGNPMRLIPYTAMPQNIPPRPAPGPAPNVPKSFEGKQLDQVIAVRDTLLNYVTAVEQQLARGKEAPAPKAEASKTSGGGR
jgi:cbb3-type cytochrome oxidase cytochrome c subunit/peptidoglycan hydrolase CwlO-like protein